MTGIRVVGSNMYISTEVTTIRLMTRIYYLNYQSSTLMVNTQQLDIDGGVLSSSDGFDISADGTKLLIANFHGHGVRSASLATGFDLSSTFALTGSQKSSGGNGVNMFLNNDGTKYYMGYGTSGSASVIRQFTAATAYETASGDTERVCSELILCEC